MPTEPSPRSRPTRVHPRRRAATALHALRGDDPELRQVVLRARRWGLRHGRGCPTDALTVVVGLALDGGRAGLVSPKVWTVDRVGALLRADAEAWCRGHDVPLPADGLPDALVLWVDFLDAHRALGPGSDPAPALRGAARGRPRRPSPPGRAASRRRHPAGRDRA